VSGRNEVVNPLKSNSFSDEQPENALALTDVTLLVSNSSNARQSPKPAKPIDVILPMSLSILISVKAEHPRKALSEIKEFFK
jgi:hypothetical protein